MRSFQSSLYRVRSATVLAAGALGLLAAGSSRKASAQATIPAAASATRQAARVEVREATHDAAAARPFHVGERLTYRVRVARFKDVGRAVMWIEGPVDVRGVATELLRFDFEARVGPVHAMDRTSSWIDPVHMTSYRFAKHERHPLSSHDEEVELYPAEHRWQSSEGAGESTSDSPLDELSFMYFVRTLSFVDDTVYRFDRHFDTARNPTTVRVVRHETITTPAGEFQTAQLEMRVRDPRHYHGEGVIRINVTDDARRLPVRIESAMPVIGTAVMSLETYSAGAINTIVRR